VGRVGIAEALLGGRIGILFFPVGDDQGRDSFQEV
jgi:hypothetical protein